MSVLKRYTGSEWEEVGVAQSGSTVWADWTPTQTALDLGNGTRVARYVQDGKLVHWYFKMTFGSTSAMGTGPTFTLPVTAASTLAAGDIIGDARYRDAGTADYRGLVVLSTTSVAIFKLNRADQLWAAEADVEGIYPMTWTTGDKITARGTYEAA